MFEAIVTRLSSTLYVQIWRHRIKVSNLNTGEIFDDEPLLHIKRTKHGDKIILGIGKHAELNHQSDSEVINPFDHPRVLFANAMVADKLLRCIVDKLLPRKPLLGPHLIIQPMEEMEGGYTIIELRAFRDLARLGGMARKVTVYLGEELSAEELKHRAIESVDLDE